MSSAFLKIILELELLRRGTLQQSWVFIHLVDTPQCHQQKQALGSCRRLWLSKIAWDWIWFFFSLDEERSKVSLCLSVCFIGWHREWRLLCQCILFSLPFINVQENELDSQTLISLWGRQPIHAGNVFVKIANSELVSLFTEWVSQSNYQSIILVT